MLRLCFKVPRKHLHGWARCVWAGVAAHVVAAYSAPTKVCWDSKVCACYTLLSAVSVRHVSCAVQVPQRPLLLQGWCLALLCWTLHRWQDLTVCVVSAAVLGVVAYGWARSSACSGCVCRVDSRGPGGGSSKEAQQASQGGRMLLQQVASSIQ